MKKMNNKGFSLVELIIVIAIMAILIGVLAPQYIKYVEKSRISADKDTVDSVLKAVQTLCTDDDYYADLTSDLSSEKVEISKANGIKSTGKAMQQYMQEIYGYTNGSDANKKFKSKAFASDTVTITVEEVTNSTTKAKTLHAVAKVSGKTYDPASYN